MALPDPMSHERRWLAAMLVGAAPPLAEDRTDALLACAIEEGIVGLVHERLQQEPCVHVEFRNAVAGPAREAAAGSLMLESEFRKLLSLLVDAGMPVLLLKGSALAWWLYPTAYLRECGDIDLLFSSREQAEEAVRLLTTHGYALSQMPDDLTYELTCRR